MNRMLSLRQVCLQADASYPLFIRYFRQEGLGFQEALERARNRQRYRSWSPEELDALEGLRELVGLTWPEVGRELGIDPNLCRYRYNKQKRLLEEV